MKWYKHDANANSDAKLRHVRLKYGMEGYGLYWYCLELIAQNVEKHNLSFELEHDSEIISADTGIHYERVQEMMTYMVQLGLFERDHGIITCRKMLKRLDQSMTSNPDMRKLIEAAKENHDSVMTKSGTVMQEQNRTDENRTEQKRRKDGGKPASPDWSAVENLNTEAWERWLEDRKRRRLPKYRTTHEAEKLAKLPHDEQALCVDHSFDRYIGLFPQDFQRKALSTDTDPYFAQLRRAGNADH